MTITAKITMDKPKKGMDPTLLDRISYFCQMDVLKEYLTALIHMEVVYTVYKYSKC